MQRNLITLSAAFIVSLVAGLAFAQTASSSDAFSRAVAEGPLYAALAALLGGLLVAATPCVYPMIAVTVSVFGARQAKSRWEGAALSGAFVLGIIGMFVPLGVAAGLTGSVFGSVLQNRWVIVAIALLFLALAAAMLGAFELALPASLTNRLATVGGTGYKGAFLLGLVCGLIASPCTGPVLTGILAWIAETRSAAMGAAAMTAFALGLGTPFFLVGAFAVQLPKSGRWMVHVKSILGIVLIVVALYYLSTAFPAMQQLVSSKPAFLVAAAVVLLLGLAFGAIHRDYSQESKAGKAAKLFGVVLTSAAGFAVILGMAKPERSLAWETESLQQARAKAISEHRPLLVDFTAAWCAACKELDKRTFANPNVASEAGRFVAVKVDATDDEDPKVEATLAEFKVLGLPTVIVFDSSGKESLRYTDFVAPDRFLQEIQRVD
jgi:thiol:disulfide interchange protein DsbD